jgi:hypothetical protein
LVTCNLFTKPE